MYINLEFWISGLLQHFFRDIQYNSDNIIITINAWDAIFVKIFGFHCNWIGRNWQSDWIQLQYIRIFDAMVWTIPFEVILLDKLIHIARTIYLQRHSKGGGKWKDIPGMLLFCLDWNACCILLWNLQTDSWLISPSLAYGRGTNRGFWCLLESCIMPIYLEWL